MDYEDLSDEEKKIVRGFRNLSDSKKKAVVASKQSFLDWLKTSFSEIWSKISNYASDLWQWFKGLF